VQNNPSLKIKKIFRSEIRKVYDPIKKNSNYDSDDSSGDSEFQSQEIKKVTINRSAYRLRNNGNNINEDSNVGDNKDSIVNSALNKNYLNNDSYNNNDIQNNNDGNNEDQDSFDASGNVERNFDTNDTEINNNNKRLRSPTLIIKNNKKIITVIHNNRNNFLNINALSFNDQQKIIEFNFLKANYDNYSYLLCNFTLKNLLSKFVTLGML